MASPLELSKETLAGYPRIRTLPPLWSGYASRDPRIPLIGTHTLGSGILAGLVFYFSVVFLILWMGWIEPNHFWTFVIFGGGTPGVLAFLLGCLIRNICENLTASAMKRAGVPRWDIRPFFFKGKLPPGVEQKLAEAKRSGVFGMIMIYASEQAFSLARWSGDPYLVGCREMPTGTEYYLICSWGS